MRPSFSAARALAARHLRSYAETPAAYIALFVFFLYSSYLFALPLFLDGQATVKTLVDFAPLLLTLLIPALTMGLIAEETRSGTYETLATLPLEDWDIVLGKFAAFAALAALAVGALLFFPIVVAFLAQPPAGLDWGEALGTVGSLILLSWLLGSAGLFASSWSKSQVIGYVGAFLLGFALFMLGKVTQFLPGPAAPIADFLGFDSHARALAKGVVDTRDLAYFASLTFAFLYLTVERLQRRRL